MQLIKNIIYCVLSIQEKFLRMRLQKTIGVKNTSKHKKHYSNGCMLDLSTLAEKEKEQLEQEITNILKSNDFEPIKLLEYIKNNGTKVKFLQNASKFLTQISENEGFIYPSKGPKALYLSLLLNEGIKLKTDEIFILSPGEINKYYFLYHFYNWYAFKHGISGIDSESWELLKKYLYSDSDTKELQLSEIYKLKDAVRQDREAIEFVIKLCRNYDGAKQALNKMHNDGGAKL